jgi:hypothetical protein
VNFAILGMVLFQLAVFHVKSCTPSVTAPAYDVCQVYVTGAPWPTAASPATTISPGPLTDGVVPEGLSIDPARGLIITPTTPLPPTNLKVAIA